MGKSQTQNQNQNKDRSQTQTQSQSQSHSSRPPTLGSSAPTRQPHPDPNQYKPKAIRTSAALIYSESPFPLPPTPDMLANVRRVDLAGSGVTDVSFLQDTGVTWLSLVGCPVEKGWKAVASLKELAGGSGVGVSFSYPSHYSSRTWQV